ncbi:MAG: ABC transporter substrate-binding protein [Candidatus Tectomicrobia bacterium]|uniref:ABC transporter substrate-binding protein n=1 Tax=Tectimicrobiota bacterium TaxID=2528274 RepID=A0A932HY99_UNCTE|nr:ABC transporter substrate-binding protein [Candidatus Tectomicrobia bacterium]
MSRKTVVFAMALALLASTQPAGAQPAEIRRIGVLSPFTPSATALWHEAFRRGLRDLGWVEGRNIRVEYRYAEGREDRLPGLAADLVRLRVEVIVAAVSTDALVAKNFTKTIPIVMASTGDALGSGLVQSLARPGGNVTGLTQMAPEMGGKRLELLKEMVPGLSRVAVLWNPRGRISTLGWNETQLPARQLGIELHSVEVRSPGGLDKAFEEAKRTGAGALAIMPNPVFAGNMKRLAELAAKNRLPAVFHLKEFAETGGLVAYGPDRSDLFRRAALYVDKILKGAKPADLPVEQPIKFELVINLKTAKALGITIPPEVLQRADRVIR